MYWLNLPSLMHNQKHILSNRHILMLTIGLFAAVLSIWSLPLQMEVRKISVELEHKEDKQTDQENDDNQVYILEYQASTNQFQLQIDVLAELSDKIPEKIASIRKAFCCYLPIQERLFKTLFQHIISPNAP